MGSSSREGEGQGQLPRALALPRLAAPLFSYQALKCSCNVPPCPDLCPLLQQKHSGTAHAFFAIIWRLFNDRAQSSSIEYPI
jgi:hypothetical protein